MKQGLVSGKLSWRSAWPLVLLAVSVAVGALGLVLLADGQHLRGLYWVLASGLALKAAHDRSSFAETSVRKG